MKDLFLQKLQDLQELSAFLEYFTPIYFQCFQDLGYTFTIFYSVFRNYTKLGEMDSQLFSVESLNSSSPNTSEIRMCTHPIALSHWLAGFCEVQ